MGITGVALGTFVPTVLEGLVIMPYSMRLLHVGWVDPSSAKRLFPRSCPSLPAVAVLYALQSAVQPHNWISLGVIAAMGGLAYVLVYFVFRATATEREMVWHHAQPGNELRESAQLSLRLKARHQVFAKNLVSRFQPDERAATAPLPCR